MFSVYPKWLPVAPVAHILPSPLVHLTPALEALLVVVSCQGPAPCSERGERERKWLNAEIRGQRNSLQLSLARPVFCPACPQPRHCGLGNRTLWIKRGVIFWRESHCCKISEEQSNYGPLTAARMACATASTNVILVSPSPAVKPMNGGTPQLSNFRAI